MDLDKILNLALNKALIGKDRIKQVNSNEIADFVNKHLEAINYTRCCKSDSEQLLKKQSDWLMIHTKLEVENIVSFTEEFKQ